MRRSRNGRDVWIQGENPGQKANFNSGKERKKFIFLKIKLSALDSWSKKST